MIKFISRSWLKLLALISLYPIAYTIMNSFMDPGQLAKNSLNILPRLSNLDQYFSLMVFKAEYLIYFMNSVSITSVIIGFQLAISIIAAYGFAKYDFKFKNMLLLLYIVLLLMPFQVTFVPNLILFEKAEKLIRLKILDTHLALVLPGVFSVFGVYLMTQFIKDFPNELIEAARIDGSNELGIFFRIVLPALKPAIFALTFLLFIDYWNLIEQAIIYMNTAKKMPLSVFLENIYYRDYSVFYAGATLYILPAIYLFTKFEKYLKEGIGNGGHR